MLIAGAAIEWRRSTAWGAGALTVYFTLIVVVLMNGRIALAHLGEFGTYSGTAEQLAIACGGLIIFAAAARIDANLAARLTRAGVAVFAACAVLFGGAHFVYMNLTAPLVPSWLPLSQTFWGYATGVGHMAAGIALLARVCDRIAAILLTAMYASFAVVVHAPILIADPGSRSNWSEGATNLVLTGVAWVVADSLSRSAHAARGPTIER